MLCLFISIALSWSSSVLRLSYCTDRTCRLFYSVSPFRRGHVIKPETRRIMHETLSCPPPSLSSLVVDLFRGNQRWNMHERVFWGLLRFRITTIDIARKSKTAIWKNNYSKSALSDKRTGDLQKVSPEKAIVPGKPDVRDVRALLACPWNYRLRMVSGLAAVGNYPAFLWINPVSGGCPGCRWYRLFPGNGVYLPSLQCPYIACETSQGFFRGKTSTKIPKIMQRKNV